VVHAHGQGVAVIAQSIQGAAHQRTAGQVIVALDELAGQRLDPLGAVLQVDELQRHRADRQHGLLGPAIVLAEQGAQRGVAGIDLVQAVAQAVHVQLPLEAQQAADVVGGTGALQSAEEPQPLLGEGQRRPLQGDVRRGRCVHGRTSQRVA
jgi:hypothetical protein